MTDAIFPVVKGTTVNVDCEEGHSFEGDRIITCESDDIFTSVSEPLCIIGNYIFYVALYEYFN